MNNYYTCKLNLKILTPIIVGTERTLDGFEYVIGDGSKSKQAEAYLVNLTSFLESLPDKEQKDLLASLEQSVISFRKKIKQYEVKIINNKHYYESILATNPVTNKVNEASDANQLLVNLLPRSLHGPYLPGSSLKGALRTPIAALKNPNANDEKEALGYKTTYDDPFRAVKISDSFEVLPTYLVKVEVWNKKNNSQWVRLEKLTILKEAFRRSKENESVSASFLVTFDFRSLKKEGSFKIALDQESIAKKCREFYAKVYKHDKQYFESGADKPVIDSSWLLELEEAFNGSAKTFPLRIGWGSGALSVGVKLFNSKSTIPSLKGKKKTQPTSRRLVVTGEKFLPLGWAIGTWENV